MKTLAQRGIVFVSVSCGRSCEREHFLWCSGVLRFRVLLLLLLLLLLLTFVSQGKCVDSLIETLIDEPHVPVGMYELPSIRVPAIHFNAQAELDRELESASLCFNTFASSQSVFALRGQLLGNTLQRQLLKLRRSTSRVEGSR